METQSELKAFEEGQKFERERISKLIDKLYKCDPQGFYYRLKQKING